VDGVTKKRHQVKGVTGGCAVVHELGKGGRHRSKLPGAPRAPPAHLVEPLGIQAVGKVSGPADSVEASDQEHQEGVQEEQRFVGHIVVLLKLHLMM
jgi:hypothetical protein